MRALICRAYGPPESVENGEIDEPTCGPDQVLIDVHAAGLNFPDVLMVQGLYQTKPPLPFVPGIEAAGTIAALGANVRGLQVGQRVVAGVSGGFAERAVADASMVIPVPDAIDVNLAAGMLLTYGTAYHALADRASLRSGDRVYVSGAGGGVGVAAVGIARALGAHVIGSAASEAKRAAVKTAGADAVIDANDPDLITTLKSVSGGGIDIGLDNVGGEQFDAMLRSARWGARLLIVGFAGGTIPQIPANRALLKELDIRGVYWGDWARRNPEANRQNMAHVFALVQAGTLPARTEVIYPVEHARDAIVDLAARRIVGKAVVQIR
jgi:NADPH2:quinone reductase